jgi:hypothetical protein
MPVIVTCEGAQNRGSSSRSALWPKLWLTTPPLPADVLRYPHIKIMLSGLLGMLVRPAPHGTRYSEAPQWAPAPNAVKATSAPDPTRPASRCS